MNRILGSHITRTAALIGGYFAALALGRQWSSGFDYYIGIYFGDFLETDSLAPLFLFIICVIIFTISVLKAKGSKRFLFLRRIDWSLFVVLTFCIVFLFAFITQYSPGYLYAMYIPVSAQLVIFTVFLYLLVMAVAADIFARIRDRQFLSTLYWIDYFKLYPLNKPSGFLMAILLIGNLVLVLFVFPFALVWYLRDTGLPLFIFAMFTIIVLTYICKFILSLSSMYEKANEEKVKSERLKSELITNVSHDIRTPLTTIINYVDLLKDLPVENDEFSKYLSILGRKTDRLKVLIGDLIEASKASTGNIEIVMKELDLTEIIGQVAGEFDELFNEHKLTLILRGADQPSLVQADSRYLWRTLENIFGNAAKYSLPGTRIFSEIQKHGNETVFSLKNTSRNPIDCQTNELAEQFMRGDQSRKTEGSGLGLYIAKSLVELMGGRFSLRVTGDLFEVEIIFS